MLHGHMHVMLPLVTNMTLLLGLFGHPTSNLTNPEIKKIVSAAGVCTSCWQCACSGCQNLAWRCARHGTSIQDLRKEKEALLLCGYQAQLTREKWNAAAADVIEHCSAKRKEAESLKQEVEKQACEIAEYKTQLEDLKRCKVTVEEALASKHDLEQQVTELQSKDEALTLALHKMSRMSEICRCCPSCSRKCSEYGLILGESDAT